ncbi:chromosome partitioning protein ParA [Vibrio sp. V27_P1S3P104]|uniref:chromosome partitioning protein ParA n=1 Tax=Vibrio TaxID=662 RepID=UPI000C16D848|nr:chromosome partitioning protein ParA [Vibrio fujianensis]NAW68769.1 chromosome partitioning protein ParA [Vibrio sp. V28_P6S34P95]NAX03676.1 chromosome partitioning protein ParA [Vibrio sp. V30_P3S12P165]NAX34041.1 chromosome partitioning protein ParA [Vibrio sp. V29_P1S30P107]NAX36365.1 chromosome partitioning protein ParA [Vibrio sp. V27_P1S3P104]NAX41708.1 chromosome partitioning protein ParA [Vibrio sp. V26_P1S5P106]NNN45175.1 chromosome partitioning protein ParA [Vibrio sp. 1-1(7)]NN
MNQKNQDEHDVVIIEERDKRSYLYITIAAILGLALGGLIGSSLTATKWEVNYSNLQVQFQQWKDEMQQHNVVTAQNSEQLAQQWQAKLQSQLEAQQKEYQTKLQQVEKQLVELEKINLSLEQQLDKQKDALQSADAQNSRLNRQADMQAVLFERSRELFQKELKVKQAIVQLQQEQEQLAKTAKELKKECDIYLQGQSWDAKSDACDKQDDANSRLSQIAQMLRVHQMDLEQIKSLSEDLGL